MKKLTILQAYEKHIAKIKQHGLIIVSVLVLGIVGGLGYYGYQSSSFAKTDLTKGRLTKSIRLMDPSLADTEPKKDVKPVDMIYVAQTGVLNTGWDLVISSLDLYNRALGDSLLHNVIKHRGIVYPGPETETWLTMSIKNISNVSMPLSPIDCDESGTPWCSNIFATCKSYSSQGNLSSDSVLVPLYIMTGWQVIRPWETKYAQIVNVAGSTQWAFGNLFAYSFGPEERKLKCSLVYGSWEQDNNNSYSIGYEVIGTDPIVIEDPLPVDTGHLWVEDSIVKKWFDLTLTDITSTYNQSSNTIQYNFKLKNIGNKPYYDNTTNISHKALVFFRKRTTASNGTQILLMHNILNSPDFLNSSTTYNATFSISAPLSNWTLGSSALSNIIGNNTFNFSYSVNPLPQSLMWELSNWTYNICNELYIWAEPIIWSTESPSVLANDINVANNSHVHCTTFTKTNWTNLDNGTGNTYGYGYGYQPGYGYGYGYGYYEGRYANKPAFFYLTKPYLMISEKIYKEFKDQYTVMKKIKKDAIAKLFDRKTLVSMKADVKSYIEKQMKLSQKKSGSVREKVMEVKKRVDLHVQVQKDYSKLVREKVLR